MIACTDSLDYFGASVNIAARVSRLSQGNDVALTEKTLADQETRAEVVQHGDLEPFEPELRGYDRNFRLQRLVFSQ